MNQGDAELGAHQGQVLGAVIGPIVHVQALGQPATQDGLLENRQEGGGILRQGEGRIGDHPGGIVDEGDQIGLALDAITDEDRRSVHHIAHPQLPGLLESEAAPVGIALLAPGLAHQSMAGKQAVDR
jgi:hypothetical protein